MKDLDQILYEEQVEFNENELIRNSIDDEFDINEEEE